MDGGSIGRRIDVGLSLVRAKCDRLATINDLLARPQLGALSRLEAAIDEDFAGGDFGVGESA